MRREENRDSFEFSSLRPLLCLSHTRLNVQPACLGVCPGIEDKLKETETEVKINERKYSPKRPSAAPAGTHTHIRKKKPAYNTRAHARTQYQKCQFHINALSVWNN